MASSKPEPPLQQGEMHRILEAVAIGVIAMDRKGRITYFNRAAESITGLSAPQALGHVCREVLNSSLCEGDCPLVRMLESGETQYNEDAVLIRHQGRSVLPVKISVAPWLDQRGRIMGGVETVQGYQLAQMLNQQKGYGWDDFIGQSPQVHRIFEVLKVVAPTGVTILIEGPTGTGKDLLAHIIHQNSPRAEKPFIKVNCAALPENLLESEMFGYLRGAFTGAERDKPGRFQLADKGTIFLDEISEVPLALQAKLLRVIEDREFYPLGGRSTVKVDVRIIAASNRPLAQQVEAGKFREDLLYRLNVINIFIPPLSERSQDLPLLIRRFIQKKNVERGTYICRFSQDALDVLLNYPYPGNVRELENILEHACLLCQGDVIRDKHLPWRLREQAAAPIPMPGAVRNDERAIIMGALEQAGWNRTQAAKTLRIDRTTLWRRMKRLNISEV